jgi:hypothetical protein
MLEQGEADSVYFKVSGLSNGITIGNETFSHCMILTLIILSHMLLASSMYFRWNSTGVESIYEYQAYTPSVFRGHPDGVSTDVIVGTNRCFLGCICDSNHKKKIPPSEQ